MNQRVVHRSGVWPHEITAQIQALIALGDHIDAVAVTFDRGTFFAWIVLRGGNESRDKRDSGVQFESGGSGDAATTTNKRQA